ncbi:MAG: sulfatase-like hydrolase/transferase [Arenicellales bacterium WSBS_2016_MAG_OTU3]
MTETKTSKPNILFIMADQLRHDYLGCTGHPTIKTPNIDALAKRGVTFTNAFCQGPVCGSSRASFYTGRYVCSHGSTYNGVPLRTTEWTLADYLKPQGYRTAVVGKTHIKQDHAGLQRLDVDTHSPAIANTSGGFESYAHDDGLHPEQVLDPKLKYNAFLRDNGFAGHNPWHDWANAGEGPNGEILSGWLLRHARTPARLPDEFSETAYMTNRAMDFMRESQDQPWCLHLSYIKPHWPYIASPPYHNMYSGDDVVDAIRDHTEKKTTHPLHRAFMRHGESKHFAKQGVRHTVVPTYMGLVSQIDTHLGRLFDYMSQQNLFDNTIIVVTSDHGDFLGDHWLGEKELFFESSLKIPLIVYDPVNGHGNKSGKQIDSLVEAIDLIPSFIDWTGNQQQPHRLEGRSLANLSKGNEEQDWRHAVFSELDYAWRPARAALKQPADRCRGTMLRTRRWKYIHYLDLPPQLFDLETDPHELHDLGTEVSFDNIRNALQSMLLDWSTSRAWRSTLDNAFVASQMGKATERGYIFDQW